MHLQRLGAVVPWPHPENEEPWACHSNCFSTLPPEPLQLLAVLRLHCWGLLLLPAPGLQQRKQQQQQG